MEGGEKESIMEGEKESFWQGERRSVEEKIKFLQDLRSQKIITAAEFTAGKRNALRITSDEIKQVHQEYDPIEKPRFETSTPMLFLWILFRLLFVTLVAFLVAGMIMYILRV